MKRSGWFVVLAFFLASFSTDSDGGYPKDYFRSPVNRPILLSGTFGELRPNHFHAGIDIKAVKGIGESIFGVADGFVSRIRVSSRGYGNALYIDHPNGYTSVYAHLHNFSAPLAKYVKEQQYILESFEIDINPDSALFPISKGEVIGFLGNSGSSFGPHLHFEIRDTKSETPINPLHFGFKIQDATSPELNELKIYHLDQDQNTLKEEVFEIRKTGGAYQVSQDVFEVESDFLGIGLKSYDRMDGVRNLNGIYSMEVLVDGQKTFEFQMEKIGWEESSYINAHCDYEAWRADKSRFNRAYLLPGNKLSIYREVLNKGVIPVYPEKASKIELVCKDIYGNPSTLTFYARRSDQTIPIKHQSFNYMLPHAQESIIKAYGAELHFPEGSFYQDLFLNYEITSETSDGFYSDIHHIGNDRTPLHKDFTIKIFPRNIPENNRSKALIARCEGEELLESLGGEWENGYLKAKADKLGDFCIVLDTIAPDIRAVKFQPVMSSGYRMLFKITDNLSGIASYRGTIDGKWIMMSYDQKYRNLIYEIDPELEKGSHFFELTVTDQRGNIEVYKSTFSK